MEHQAHHLNHVSFLYASRCLKASEGPLDESDKTPATKGNLFRAEFPRVRVDLRSKVFQLLGASVVQWKRDFAKRESSGVVNFFTMSVSLATN